MLGSSLVICGFFLFFFSPLLWFVTVNCYKTRMRPFAVVSMSNKSSQDKLFVTKTWVPPLWNLISVATKKIACPFFLFFKYVIPLCSLLQAVFYILFAELVKSECFIKASLGEGNKQFLLHASSRVIKASEILTLRGRSQRKRRWARLAGLGGGGGTHKQQFIALVLI